MLHDVQRVLADVEGELESCFVPVMIIGKEYLNFKMKVLGIKIECLTILENLLFPREDAREELNGIILIV